MITEIEQEKMESVYGGFNLFDLAKHMAVGSYCLNRHEGFAKKMACCLILDGGVSVIQSFGVEFYNQMKRSCVCLSKPGKKSSVEYFLDVDRAKSCAKICDVAGYEYYDY